MLKSIRISRSEERRVGKEWRSLCDWSSDVCSSDLYLLSSVSQAHQIAYSYSLSTSRAESFSIHLGKVILALLKMHRNLRTYLDLLTRENDLITIDAEVDPYLEIGRASCRERVEITV